MCHFFVILHRDIGILYEIHVQYNEQFHTDAVQSRQAAFVRYCLKFRKIRLTRVRFRTRLLYLIRDGYLTLGTHSSISLYDTKYDRIRQGMQPD